MLLLRLPVLCCRRKGNNCLCSWLLQRLSGSPLRNSTYCLPTCHCSLVYSWYASCGSPDQVPSRCTCSCFCVRIVAKTPLVCGRLNDSRAAADVAAVAAIAGDPQFGMASHCILCSCMTPCCCCCSSVTRSSCDTAGKKSGGWFCCCCCC